MVSERLVKIIPDPSREKEEELRADARKIRLQAMNEVYDIYKRLSQIRRDLLPASKRNSRKKEPWQIELDCPESVVLGEEIRVHYKIVSGPRSGMMRAGIAMIPIVD